MRLKTLDQETNSSLSRCVKYYFVLLQSRGDILFYAASHLQVHNNFHILCRQSWSNICMCF